jgi:hypothetical protein
MNSKMTHLLYHINKGLLHMLEVIQTSNQHADDNKYRY